MSKLRIGIDLGGSKTEVAVLAEDAEIVLRERCITPQGDYQATLNTIKELVLKADEFIHEKIPQQITLPVGVAAPGSLSSVSGLIRNSNSTCLNGQALLEDLKNLLQRPVRIANDANCLALSEAIDGAGRDLHTVFAIILGTGVGGGIVVDKNILTGANGIAGEWGHCRVSNPNPEARSCYCGRQDCIETYFSGPGLIESYRRLTNETLSAEEIVENMRQGHQQAGSISEDYCEQLAVELARIINILDPDIIVAGGGLSNVDELYREVANRWGKYIFSDVVNTKFVPAQYGDSSGVRGAAWLF